jgi:hypothetical protein
LFPFFVESDPVDGADAEGETGVESHRELDSTAMSEVVRGIPGALARIQNAREQVARGDGIPLEEL